MDLAVNNPTLDMKLVERGSFVRILDNEGKEDYGIVVNRGLTFSEEESRVRIATFQFGWKKNVRRDVSLGEVEVVSDRLVLNAMKGTNDGLYEMAVELGGVEGVLLMRASYELREYRKFLEVRDFVNPAESVSLRIPGPMTGRYLLGANYKKRKDIFLPYFVIIDPEMPEEKVMELLWADKMRWQRHFQFAPGMKSFLVYGVPEEAEAFMNTETGIRFR